MNTGITDSVKAKILNALTGKTESAKIASTCLIGLGTTTDSSFVEPDKAYGYSRTLIGDWQSKDSQLMGEPSGGNIKNSKIIYLPEATQSWGTVTHFALFDSATSETPILVGELKTAIEISAGYVPVFRAGTLSLTIK